MHDLLVSQGYKLIDDAWNEHGRYTYIHDDDAGPAFIKGLAGILRSAGWDAEPGALRTFRDPSTSCVIELEPGGSETTGHYLHYMKSSEPETFA